MSDYVIDASAALACVLRSQSTAASINFIETRDRDRLVAPHIFGWEVGNVLLNLNRRRSLSDGAYDAALAELDSLEIALEPALSEFEMRELRRVARDVRLSLFDAAYMRMAAGHGCILVSRDARLLEMAAAGNVECVDLR